MNEMAAAGAVDEMQRALEDGVAKLHDLKVSRPARSLVGEALKVLAQRDSDKALSSVESLQGELRAVDKILSEIVDSGIRAQRAEAQAHPFASAWMSELRRRLAKDESRGDPRAWFTSWMTAWAEALAASRWECCAEVVGLARTRPDLAVLQNSMNTVSERLRDNAPSEVVPAVVGILARGDLPATAAVLLNVLASRCWRQIGDQVAAATDAANTAVRLSEGLDPAISSLARAAQAEVFLDLDRPDEARGVIEDGFESRVVAVDLIIAAGLLASRDGTFGRATDYFDAAAYRFGLEAVEPHLLREVPGNLLWRTARRVRLTDKEAGLALFDRALEEGIDGAGEYPERRVLRERAQLLEELHRYDAAAEGYRDAADRYAATGSKAAVKLYGRACALAPEVAIHHWSYGEALRTSVDPRDPDLATGLLAKAAAALDQGFSKADPDADTAWALVSSALISRLLPDGPDPTLLIERALLLNRNDPRTLAFLVMVLRAQGYPREAAESGEASLRGDSEDELPTLHAALALADLGRYQEALDSINAFDLYWGPTDNLTLVRALMHLRLGDSDAALRISQELTAQEEAQFFRGICFGVRGEDDEERRCFEAVWHGRGDKSDPSRVGWAAYRIGLLDEAIEQFSDLVDRATAATRNLVDELDLGQVLLARGDPERRDAFAGQEHLASAIRQMNHVEDLVHLRSVEFPLLRKAVRGAAHEGAVTAALGPLEHLVDDRCRELRMRERTLSTPAVELALARRAFEGEDYEQALDRYQELVRSDGPKEARQGVEDAALKVLELADARLADDDLPLGRATWLRLSTVLDQLPERTSAALSRQLNARLALSLLELEGPAGSHTIESLAQSDTESITQALSIFARDIPRAWAHYDGLRSLAATAGSPGDPHLLSLAAEVPFDRVYALSRNDFGDGDLDPFVGAISMVIGPYDADLISSERMHQGLPDLRQKLMAEMGVRIPGVRVSWDDELAPGTAQFLVYDQVAGEVGVPSTAPDPVGAILASFEQVLRDNLFRWVSHDDVDLWAVGWDVISPEAEPLWQPVDPAQRLRLARLLRMLLREGLSVRDRVTILAGFRHAEDGQLTDPVDALASVRPLLYPATLGPDPQARVWPVPEELQERLARGLVAGGVSAWELPRDTVRDLVQDLRDWRSAATPSGPVAVEVRDEAVRLVLFRLLAADRPRVFVLAKGDLP